jgi:hypothetical protein
LALTTLDPVEQEIQELLNRLRLEGPKPRQICGGEANQIIRFLRENPTVTEFASSGIERYLANAACLPDGRALLVYRGKPTSTALPWIDYRGDADEICSPRDFLTVTLMRHRGQGKGWYRSLPSRPRLARYSRDRRAA